MVPNLHDLQGLITPWTWSRQEFRWGLDLTYDIVFFIDCGVALIGYSAESRWLGNKTRSVEPTALGWAAALACYPPYNNLLGTYLPLETGVQVVTSDATAPEDPVASIKVADVDVAYEDAQRRGYEIVHPLSTESWGVRRFFVRAPDGNVLNIVQHHE